MKKGNKTAIITSVVVVICMLVVGGALWFANRKDPVNEGIDEEPVNTETLMTSVEQADLDTPEVTDELEVTPSPEVNMPVIEISTMVIAEELVQPMQEVPEKPETPETLEALQDLPELKEGTDLTDPDRVPEYKEEPEPTIAPSDTVVTKPSTSESHPGQIYVEGFGWVDYSGSNQGEGAEDMYLNGNKIGDM